jgi:cytidylate kinase
MKITINGIPGSGKSTACKNIARMLNLKHYSVGDKMREMAEKRDITLIELSKIAQKDKRIDEELDNWQIEIGRKEDNFIMDGRLSWHFIPNSIKILLVADPNVIAERVYHQKRPDEQYNTSIEETKKLQEHRLEIEKKRYKQYYELDYTDKKHYDIIYDTSVGSAEENSKKLVTEITNFIDGLKV